MIASGYQLFDDICYNYFYHRKSISNLGCDVLQRSILTFLCWGVWPRVFSLPESLPFYFKSQLFLHLIFLFDVFQFVRIKEAIHFTVPLFLFFSL